MIDSDRRLRIILAVFVTIVLVVFVADILRGKTVPELFTVLAFWIALPLVWIMTIVVWSITRRARADPANGHSLAHVVALVVTSFTAIVTVFAIVFANNGMAHPVLDLWQTQVITRSTVVIASVASACALLHWYRRL